MIRRAIVGALVLSATACTVTVAVTTIGDEVSVQGAWLIDGEPASPAACSAAGISTIELEFTDVTIDYTREEWTFRCASGQITQLDIDGDGTAESLPGFDTRPDLVLDTIAYTVRWVARDSSGNITHMFDPVEPLDLSALTVGSHAVLLVPNFISDEPTPPGLNVNVSWEHINGTADQACEVAQVGSASYVLTDSGGAVVSELTDAVCGPQVMFEGLDPGTYTLNVQGTHAVDGTVDWNADCSDLVVDDTGAAEFNCSVPWTSTQPIVVVNLLWDTDPTVAGATYGTCADAGVVTWSYNLMGPTVDSMMTVPCADVFYWRDLDLGSYDLTADGDDDMAVKRWMGACNAIAAPTENRVMMDCNLDDVTGG